MIFKDNTIASIFFAQTAAKAVNLIRVIKFSEKFNDKLKKKEFKLIYLNDKNVMLNLIICKVHT